MWPQEAAHSQDAAGLTVDSREARLLLLCSELCLANRIFKFLNCRPVWSLQDYIVIMDTHDAHLTFPSISFGFCFVPLAHPTSWNEEVHSMTVQKGCRDFKLPWKVTFFFLVFYISPCFFCAHLAFPHALLWSPLLVSNVSKYCYSLCNVYCLKNKMKCGVWVFGSCI